MSGDHRFAEIEAWHMSALVGRSKFRHNWTGQQTACGRGWGGHLRPAYSDDPPCPRCLAISRGTPTPGGTS